MHVFMCVEIVERKRTPVEIREEYERLQREREERRLQQRTNPKVHTHASSLSLLQKYPRQGDIYRLSLCEVYYQNTLFCVLMSLCVQGTISVGVDATDLFDRYDEDFEEMPGGGFPHIEINRMHISQSIEVHTPVHVVRFLVGHTQTHTLAKKVHCDTLTCVMLMCFPCVYLCVWV